MPEETQYDYTLSPLVVYITKDPNNESIATLTMGVNNATDHDIECDWLALIIQIGAGSGDLTSQPGRIAASSSRPNEWAFTRVEGAAGQFRAEPIQPFTGLRAGESISFQLSNIAVNGVVGSTKVDIIEMTDDRREAKRFLNKDVSALRIDYFRAVPNSIKPGENATLEWKTQSAARCTLTRAGYAPENVDVTGSRQVSPGDSANYTLNAYGVGQVQANALISVIRVKILDFSGPTDRIPPGGKAPLWWRTEFAARCELKANGVTVDPPAPLQAELTPYWVRPQKDPTTYVLFAYGTEGKPDQDQVTVFLQPRFKLSLKETWQQEIPPKLSYIATPKSLTGDKRLFAGSASTNDFHVLDTFTHKKIFTRKAGGHYFLEPSPDGKRLFGQTMLNVGILDATPGSSYPQVVTPQTQSVLGTGAAYHPDGSKVYFACGMPRVEAASESESAEANSVPDAANQGLICANTSDLSTIFTLLVGALPGGTSISPDGKTLCLVDMRSAHLYLIDIATRQITTISIGDFSGPSRIVNSVWSPDGTKVYAANCTPGTVWIVTLATRQVTNISLGADITPALLRLGPPVPDFEEGSNILYALCAPDGTVAGISTANDQVLSRLSLGQAQNPAFAFVMGSAPSFDWATMALAPDGKAVYVTNPRGDSIFVLDNGGSQEIEQSSREGMELEGTVFDYVVSPTTVYITRDPENPSYARLDVGVTNNTGADTECDWVSFIVIPGAGRGELTTDPGSITVSSSRPDDWSITPIGGAPGQFRAEPIFPNTGLKAGDSVSFQLANIVVNGELGGTNFDIAEFVGETRGRSCPLNKVRGDLNIDYFHSEPSDITPGATSKLSWKTVAAAKCILSWPTGSEEVDVTGSKHVSPSDTTIYTLTAHGGLGPDVSAQRAVVVNKVIVLLDASPKTVALDGSSMLTWKVLNAEADSCRLDPGDFHIAPIGEKLVSLDKTTTYTVSARAGNSNGHNAITVSVAPPRILFFRSTTPANPGDPVTLSWDVQYAKAVFIDQGVGQVPLVGSKVVANINQTKYTLTCLGLGEPVKAEVTVPGNRVQILSLIPQCIDTPYSCNERFFGVHYTCTWYAAFATSAQLIRVSDNVVVATQSGEFKYYTWAPAARPEIEYKLVAQGPAGPAIRHVRLGWSNTA